MDYLAQAKSLEDRLSEIRKDLHRHPELGNEEFYTSRRIEEILKDMGLDVRRILDTALVATLHGRDTGKKVALRADMDALPVTEDTHCGFESENPGVMHACGHDIHMTSAIGAAMLLSQNKENLEGDVIFLFQPNEERSGGSKRMIAAGAVDGVSAVFGGHVSPDLPLGIVGLKYGKFYAASVVFKIRFKGSSCHGATPEKGIDALLVAAETVTKLKTLKPSSGDRCVLSTCIFNSGNVCNVIPGEAYIEGMIRTLGKDDKDEMQDKLRKTVDDVCAKYGASADVELIGTYDGVVNTDEETAVMERSARQVLGDANVVVLDQPTMVTEDFGFFVDRCTGSFCHVGAGCTESLHSPHFIPDIKAAVTASAVYACTLDNYLKKT
ncbi:MAG: amidohydrolase [Spirochaetales bacterium]|nr:amidohydrolase [Spirochaetales bacterium]